MKRVLIITYYWPPSGGAGVQRWLKFSKFLPEFGWEPVILTVDPAKATYPVLDESLQHELRNDIKVIRTNSTEWFSFYKKVSKTNKVPYAGFANESDKISLKQKAARFFRGNFFLPDPRKGWNKHAIRAAKSIIKDTEIDCIVTTGPPHSTQLIGQKLSKKYNIPWIADFRDPWTDIYYYRQFYPTLPARKINLNFEKRVLKEADLILTVSQGFKKIFVNKGYFKPEKVKIIPNGFDEQDFQKTPEPKGNPFTITYVGTLSDIYPIEILIEALLELLGDSLNIKLQFIGSVSNNQRQKLSKIPKENIEFIEYVEHKTAIKYMGESNLLLLVIPEHSSGEGILPGKIFEYMASERKVLGIGPLDGDSATILKETDTGVMVSFKDVKGIKQVLNQFYNDSQKSESIKKETKYLKYSRKNLTEELANCMNALIK